MEEFADEGRQTENLSELNDFCSQRIILCEENVNSYKVKFKKCKIWYRKSYREHKH